MLRLYADILTANYFTFCDLSLLKADPDSKNCSFRVSFSFSNLNVTTIPSSQMLEAPIHFANINNRLLVKAYISIQTLHA